MCGITGFLSSSGFFSKENLITANNAISHRGPDAEGHYFNEKLTIGLGHRRLSILDLSTGANQPMFSSCGRYVMVYNGEVYNFQEIQKARLPNHIFKTTSDTEVILECFAKYGLESFQWFNGMFAFAIWDILDQRLTLARDGIGIKPLYYYFENGNFVFGSELKAIKKFLPLLSINKEAIPFFLHLGYIPHPLSIYKNVWKFPAGNYLQLDIGDVFISQSDFKPFWSLNKKIEKEIVVQEADAKKQLDKLLTKAVEKQLISDVPIGTFLSGGVDSSIVTAIASKVSEKRVKTFSIAVLDGKVNEAPYAAAVAKHLGTEHYELPIKERDILDMIPGFMEVYDEPFADSSAFPTMLVSKLAREYVTVTLSGDGGDELFMGYGFYTWAKRLNHPALQLFRKPIYHLSKMAPTYFQQAGKMLNYPSVENSKSHIFSQEYFDENELKDLLIDNNSNFIPFNKNIKADRSLLVEEKQSFWDIENYLKDDLLVKVDRASMRFGLETRVPLLDNTIVEFALNLESDLKVKNGISKYLLKEVLYEYVPARFFERPKWGFGIPLEKWFNKELSFLYEKYFSSETIKKHGIINHNYFLDLKSKYEHTLSPQYKGKVWSILVLHWWLSENT